MLLGDKITKNLAHPQIICHYLWSHSCFFSLLVHYSINSQPYAIAQCQRQVPHLVLVATVVLTLVGIVAVHRQLVGVHQVTRFMSPLYHFIFYNDNKVHVQHLFVCKYVSIVEYYSFCKLFNRHTTHTAFLDYI